MTRPAAPATGFSAAWLRQREPYDAAARDVAAPRLRLQQRLAAWRPQGSAPLRVIDLACGTGANLRWLAPQLGGDQQWLVVDHDAALLRRWPASLPAAGCSSGSPLLQFAGAGFRAGVLRRRLDLAAALESLPWQAAQLVTGSALLDLVSAAWLQRLATVATSARAAMLMAMSVDGRLRWAPVDTCDGDVAWLFGAHQQRDKGFAGPALGAAAGAELVAALRRAGYRVSTGRSDWWLDGRSDAQALALQRVLIDGMAAAAVEQRPTAAVTVESWRRRRHALAPRSTLLVGHLDVLALPPR